MASKNPVAVSRKSAETVQIVPNNLVWRMKKMCSVGVNLDTGFAVKTGVSIAADMRPPVNHNYSLSKRGGNAFRDSSAIKPRTNDKQVGAAYHV